MDDKIPELTVIGDVAHWCAVDTRIGSLTCVLEYNHCFDAEVYADELDFDERIDFKEDQRSASSSRFLVIYYGLCT